MVLLLGFMPFSASFAERIDIPSAMLFFVSFFSASMTSLRALLVLRKSSHSRLGFEFSAVMISIWSPFWSSYESGTSFWFTLAAMALSPMWEWTVYAKSSAVAPFGMVLLSPFGV